MSDIFDISAHISDLGPDLVSALEDSMRATRNLVTKVVNLGAGSGGDAYIRCQKAQTEVSCKILLWFYKLTVNIVCGSAV